MEGDAVYRKTPKGADEIDQRVHRLSSKERLLLILFDGTRSMREIAGAERDWADVAQKLLDLELIELLPTEEYSADSGGSNFTASVWEQTHTILEPTFLGASLAAYDARGSESQGWITSTITRLSSMVLGAAGPNYETPPIPERDRKIPFLDLSIAPSQERAPAAHGSASSILGPLSVQPVKLPEPEPFDAQKELDALLGLASLRDSIAPLPSEAKSVKPRSKEAPATPSARLKPLSPGRRVAPPSVLSPTEAPSGLENQDSVGRSPASPLNSGDNGLSNARGFMKESLWRLSGQYAQALMKQIDTCDSQVELQAQFEAWLRTLLLTRQGCQEAPTLAAQLLRLFLQG